VNSVVDRAIQAMERRDAAILARRADPTPWTMRQEHATGEVLREAIAACTDAEVYELAKLQAVTVEPVKPGCLIPGVEP